jgi:hypothetical protein
VTARQPTITIGIVCSPEQLADVQARVSALQADLQRVGGGLLGQRPPRAAAASDDDPRAAHRDPQAFLAGFAETERSIHFDPELARRQRELLEEQHG